MHIVAVGLNYRTAPVEIREQFAVDGSSLPEALRGFKQTESVQECVIVSTCNRTELYAAVDRPQICGHHVRGFMETWFGIPRERLNDYLYIHEGRRAIEHLFRVACGLDSMVIGETQILGQVKEAFFAAQNQKTTGTVFNTLFKRAITLAKRAHSETGIGENPVSVSYAAVELGKRIFGEFRGKKVLVIGAGKMSELTMKHLSAGGADRIAVVNRTFEKAAELAGKMNGVPRAMNQLEAELAAADIVISSTGAPGYVLTKEMVQQACGGRKSRPLFMIDIAVPRDIDPNVSELQNVYLYDIDDLEQIVETNLNERRRIAGKIERMIAEEIDSFEQWYKLLAVNPVIEAIQKKTRAIHEETMNSLLNKLPGLDEREVKVIRKLTLSMMNQMMREPIARMKELTAERGSDEALDTIVRLFALEDTLGAEEKAERRSDAAVIPVRKEGQDKTARIAAMVAAGGNLLAGS
jgi:glutamyl-tRNA reductase